jgi:hypothetical protein
VTHEFGNLSYPHSIHKSLGRPGVAGGVGDEVFQVGKFLPEATKPTPNAVACERLCATRAAEDWTFWMLRH